MATLRVDIDNKKSEKVILAVGKIQLQTIGEFLKELC